MPTRRFVLVAAHEYNHHQLDYVAIAKSRADTLLGTVPSTDDYEFWLFDVSAGHRLLAKGGPGQNRTLTWVIEAIQHDRLEKPLYRPFKLYFELSAGAATLHTDKDYFVKSALHQQDLGPPPPTVMGAAEVYLWVARIGELAPGTLHELSIFSHSFHIGPILANTLSYMVRFELPNNRRWATRKIKKKNVRFRQYGLARRFADSQRQERDRWDMDFRRSDFDRPTVRTTKQKTVNGVVQEVVEKIASQAHLKAAFATLPDSPAVGGIRVWGCSVDYGLLRFTRALHTYLKKYTTAQERVANPVLVVYTQEKHKKSFEKHAGSQSTRTTTVTKGKRTRYEIRIPFADIPTLLKTVLEGSWTYRAAVYCNTESYGVVPGAGTTVHRSETSMAREYARLAKDYATLLSSVTDYASEQELDALEHTKKGAGKKPFVRTKGYLRYHPSTASSP